MSCDRKYSERGELNHLGGVSLWTAIWLNWMMRKVVAALKLHQCRSQLFQLLYLILQVSCVK